MSQCRTLRSTLFGKVKLCYDQVTSSFGKRSFVHNRLVLFVPRLSRSASLIDCLVWSFGLAVAVKVSRTDQVNKKLTSSGELLLENPHEEVRLMKLLARGNDGKGHPNVLRLLDHTESGDLSWSVLEFASKGEFFDLISNGGRLTNADAAKYFAQLADGVSYMHAHRVVHLDLSLENMLLDGKNQVKICDFGMARQLQPIAVAKSEMELMRGRPGKIGYMAPEVFEGKAFDGRQADCFSLGVCLFMLLTGLPPFRLPSNSGQFLRTCMNLER